MREGRYGAVHVPDEAPRARSMEDLATLPGSVHALDGAQLVPAGHDPRVMDVPGVQAL